MISSAQRNFEKFCDVATNGRMINSASSSNRTNVAVERIVQGWSFKEHNNMRIETELVAEEQD